VFLTEHLVPMAISHTLVESEGEHLTSTTTCLATVSIFAGSVERPLEGERCAFFTISESVLLQNNDRTDVGTASSANVTSMDPNSYLTNHFVLNERKYPVHIVRPVQHRLSHYSQLLLSHQLAETSP
jgi:hypothetical protein